MGRGMARWLQGSLELTIEQLWMWGSGTIVTAQLKKIFFSFGQTDTFIFEWAGVKTHSQPIARPQLCA